MLKNTIFAFNQAMKLNYVSIGQHQLNHKILLFQKKSNPNLYCQRLTLSCKYSFLKNDVTIDYKKNYYEILQVNQKALLAEIKKNFYKLAKQCHPDTSKGNQDLFKSINEAYNVLSHAQRRKIYDANRVRKDENPNNQKAQAQRNSKQQPRQSTTEQDPQSSQQYEHRKQQAYYHYNRGQWQQFRSGYKYHISPQSQYFNNMTNNLSVDKIYQNMKRNHQKKAQKDEAFLSEMEKYFAYIEKIKQKKQKDINDYHAKIDQIQKQLAQERKLRFRKSLIGKGFTKVQNVFAKLSDVLSKFLNRSTNEKENHK